MISNRSACVYCTSRCIVNCEVGISCTKQIISIATPISIHSGKVYRGNNIIGNYGLKRCGIRACCTIIYWRRISLCSCLSVSKIPGVSSQLSGVSTYGCNVIHINRSATCRLIKRESRSSAWALLNNKCNDETIVLRHFKSKGFSQGCNANHDVISSWQNRRSANGSTTRCFTLRRVEYPIGIVQGEFQSEW